MVGDKIDNEEKKRGHWYTLLLDKIQDSTLQFLTRVCRRVLSQTSNI